MLNNSKNHHNRQDENSFSSWNIKFTKLWNREDIRKQIYKKITKKDFIMAFMFSFLFIFWVFWVQDFDKFFWNNFKADLFDNTVDQTIYDWEQWRTFQPTLSFYPENKVIKNWELSNNGKNYLNYYTLDTPDNIISISLDNITSNPNCSYWWKYKFQWTNKYLKLWESVNEDNIWINWVNYPLLSIQSWIWANYKIDLTSKIITIYFDKDIKNAKFYDFALKDWIKIYSDYKNLTEFNWTFTTEISWNELKLNLSKPFNVDFWRILIWKNLISDLDWRVNTDWWVVWLKIWENFVIDNKKPEKISDSTWNLVINVSFGENIFENPNKNLIDNIEVWNKKLSEIGQYSEYNIEWNELKIYFTSSVSWDLKILSWAVIDKSWNENWLISFTISSL